MKELLPLMFGSIVGAVLMVVPAGLRRCITAPICIVVGAFASAVNGELSHTAWALFVSFDALIVWGAAIAVMTAVWSWRRVRGTPDVRSV